jgi:hypothetical protein
MDNENELEYIDTADIQHDLALGLASGETLDNSLNAKFAEELRKRNAPLPINCRWEYDIYAYMKQRLHYDLETQ